MMKPRGTIRYCHDCYDCFSSFWTVFSLSPSPFLWTEEVNGDGGGEGDKADRYRYIYMYIYVDQ